MKLSRTVSYALQATLHLAQLNSGEPVPSSRLASEGRMPERFLLQILRTLVAHQILSSTRGVEGGYVLGRSAERISLLEIVEAIDGPIVPSLPSAEGLPGKTRQKLEAVLAEVADRTRLQLGAISLAALLPERPAATSERASFGTQRIADSARRIAVRGPQSRSAEPLAVTAKTI